MSVVIADLEAGLPNLRDAARGGSRMDHLIDAYGRLARHFAEPERDGFYTVFDGEFHIDALDAAAASRRTSPTETSQGQK